MKKIAFIIESVALVASIVWYYNQPGYEPVITALIAEAINKTATPFTTIKIPVKSIITKKSGQVLRLNDAVNLSIPANACIDENGKPATDVKLSFKDLQHPVDQFLAGVPNCH